MPDLRTSETDMPPRVTIVQREKTRILANVADMAAAVLNITGTQPRMIDFAYMSVSEQIEVAHSTDIMIMVHGGALSSMLWMPYGSILVDIYPYGFRAASNSQLVHWARRAIAPWHIGHAPFQITDSRGQTLTSGPLPKGCTCIGGSCVPGELFWHTVQIEVDVASFTRHLAAVLKQWRGGPDTKRTAYAPPLTKHEDEMRTAKDQEQRLKKSSKAVQCM